MDENKTARRTTAPSGRSQTTRKKRKHRRRVAGIWKILGTLVLVCMVTCAFLACFAAVYIKTVIIPQAGLDLHSLSMDMSLSSTMYYNDPETGALTELRTIHGEENRIWIEYDKIPKNLINAAIAIEDKRFETHHGVDWRRTARGVMSLFTGGNIQGGSTITQQLIKNVTTDNEATVKRKILEIFRALEVEKNYSKEDIMEWYLNYIYLGQGCNGVYTASYAYFGKNVTELSLAECASLISITNNPSMFDPYRAGLNEDGTINYEWGRKNNANRAINVLYQMYDQEKISEAEYNEASEQVKAGLNFTSAKATDSEAESGTQATVSNEPFSWYEDQVIKDVINDLIALGYDRKLASNMLYYGGLTIETCLDPNVQAIVDSVYENIDNLNVISSSGQQLQSAIVIVDPEGDVIALSGGMGTKEGSRTWSRASDTKRAPGSSIKPLSVYAPAIELGLITPNSAVDDFAYRLEGENAWPVNSYGYYNGIISIYKAVEVSSNPAALRILSKLTPQASYDFMCSIGFQNDLVYGRERNGKVWSDIDLSPLSMGGLTDGVTVLHMAAAYSMFPRAGVYLEPRTYYRVLDNNGNVILDKTTDRVGVPVISEKTAWYINNMLKNVVAQGTGTAANFRGMTIAGKTGSTTSNMDRWFVGYTPYYTAAVWCGYDQQERIKTTNGNPAAIMWKKVMSQLHEGLETKDFDNPGGLKNISYCAASGKLATEYCQMDPRGNQIVSGWFFSDDGPTEYCTVHTETSVMEICTADPILNSAGEETGMYHLAGPFCPDDCRKSICLMDVERGEYEGVTTRDAMYTRAYYTSMGEAAYCTIHTTQQEPEYDPINFDPFDETTWPTEEQWPGFRIEDPETWPIYITPGGEDDPEPPADDPVESDPGTDTDPEPTAEPEPSGEPEEI